MKTNLLKKGICLFFGSVLAVSSLKAVTYTAVTSGNWSSAATWGGVGPGTNLSTDDISIPSGITVTLDQDVTFSGILNNFTVNGVLSSSTSNSLTMNQGTLAGSGTINIHKIVFGSSTFLSSTFNGTMNVNTMLNTGATLMLGSIMNIADTLNLDAGSLVLNSGSNLTMLTGSWIRVNNGALAMGTGVFNSNASYNVIYVGGSKNSGVELSSTAINDVKVMLNSGSATLTLLSDMEVNGDLSHTMGIIDLNGMGLTIHDNYTATGAASLNGNGGDVTIDGSAFMSSAMDFNSSSTLNNLTVNMGTSGQARISGDLTLNGTVTLTEGDVIIENASTLTMGTGSTIKIYAGGLTQNGGTFDGSASYSVEYLGGPVAAGAELSGSGVNNVTVDLVDPIDVLSMTGNATVAGTFNLNKGRLNLQGNDLILNGVFNQGAGSEIIGNATSRIELNVNNLSGDTIYFDAANMVLSSLILNPGISSTLTLGTDLTIVDELNLTGGHIELHNHDLTLNSTAIITGYSYIHYVKTSGTGRLIMHVNTSAPYVVFPVGTENDYSPASIQQTAAGTSGNFMVRVKDGVYINGTSGTNLAASQSVVDRTWFIESNETINTNIKLGWTAMAEVNGFNRAQSYISHYMNSSWDSYATSSASVNGSVYESTRTGITSLSPFAVADNNAALLVKEPSIVGEFKLYPNPASETINLEIIGDKEMFKYEVIDLMGKTVTTATNANGFNSFDISALPSGCYFIKATDVNTQASITKKFVKD